MIVMEKWQARIDFGYFVKKMDINKSTYLDCSGFRVGPECEIAEEFSSKLLCRKFRTDTDDPSSRAQS